MEYGWVFSHSLDSAFDEDGQPRGSNERSFSVPIDGGLIPRAPPGGTDRASRTAGGDRAPHSCERLVPIDQFDRALADLARTLTELARPRRLPLVRGDAPPRQRPARDYAEADRSAPLARRRRAGALVRGRCRARPSGQPYGGRRHTATTRHSPLGSPSRGAAPVETVTFSNAITRTAERDQRPDSSTVQSTVFGPPDAT